jgi:uncharacterized membrane protein
MPLTLLHTLVPVGRRFFAVALVAFGLQHLIYGDFVTRVVLSWPAWAPGRAFWAYVVGAGLIAAGLALLSSKMTRSMALLLGALLLLSFVGLSLPVAVAGVAWGGEWTSALKALALSGGAFIVAGTLPATTATTSASATTGSNRTSARGGRAGGGGGAAITASLEPLIPTGRFFLAAFLLLGGIQHFIWAPFVATLVPAWIPGQLFWTYFAGVALIAGAVGLIVPQTTRLAAALTGLMIFTWVIVLHIPRAVAYWGTANGNETTATFEALAFSGVAFILAGFLPTVRRQP